MKDDTIATQADDKIHSFMQLAADNDHESENSKRKTKNAIYQAIYAALGNTAKLHARLHTWFATAIRKTMHRVVKDFV